MAEHISERYNFYWRELMNNSVKQQEIPTMASQSSFSLLIKGIGGIVSRHPKIVNYSTFNGQKTKVMAQIKQE